MKKDRTRKTKKETKTGEKNSESKNKRKRKHNSERKEGKRDAKTEKQPSRCMPKGGQSTRVIQKILFLQKFQIITHLRPM